jgi:hypothetical protein
MSTQDIIKQEGSIIIELEKDGFKKGRYLIHLRGLRGKPTIAKINVFKLLPYFDTIVRMLNLYYITVKCTSPGEFVRLKTHINIVDKFDSSDGKYKKIGIAKENEIMEDKDIPRQKIKGFYLYKSGLVCSQVIWLFLLTFSARPNTMTKYLHAVNTPHPEKFLENCSKYDDRVDFIDIMLDYSKKHRFKTVRRGFSESYKKYKNRAENTCIKITKGKTRGTGVVCKKVIAIADNRDPSYMHKAGRRFMCSEVAILLDTMLSFMKFGSRNIFEPISDNIRDSALSIVKGSAVIEHCESNSSESNSDESNSSESNSSESNSSESNSSESDSSESNSSEFGNSDSDSDESNSSESNSSESNSSEFGNSDSDSDESNSSESNSSEFGNSDSDSDSDSD